MSYFVPGLISSKGTKIQARILLRLEQDPKLLQAVVDEYNQIIRHDSVKIEEKELHMCITLKPRRFKKEINRLPNQIHAI